MSRRTKTKSRPSATPTPATPATRRVWPWMLVAAGLGGLVYLNALDNPFAYDDIRTVVENPSLRDPNPVALLVYERFRPLVNLSYAVDFQLWQLEPRGYHLTGTLLHMLYIALFFVAARAALGDARRRVGEVENTPPPVEHLAFGAAAVHAVHPLMSESVGYISGRSEVLCGVFLLASLLAFRSWMQGGKLLSPRLGAALGFFVLAGASKEVGAMLPFLAALWDVLLGPAEGRRRRFAWIYAPLMLLVSIAGAWRVWSFVAIEDPLVPRSVWQNVMTQWEVIWRYLGLLAWPAEQSLIHPAQRVATPLDPLAWAAGLGLLALCALGWKLRRRAPLVGLGIGWFLLLLAPSSSFVPLNELMSEHRVYAASGGFFLVLAWLVGRLRPPPRVAAVALAVLVAGLGWATVERNRVWADPITLWTDTADKAPLTWRAVVGLAQAHRDAGDCEAAIPLYERAVELQDDDSGSLVNLGICHAQAKRYREAYAAFLEAVRRDPGLAAAHTNLGRLALMLGRRDEARRHLETALALEPGNEIARALMGRLVTLNGG